MAVLQLLEASLNLGGKDLLLNANLAVEAGERVCLTGRNGAGKSSLLALLGGQLKADAGTVIASVPFGQMPQDVPTTWIGSVFELTAEVFGEDGRALIAAHRNEIAAQSSLEQGGGWDRYREILGVLSHLGLDPEADFSTLSGGSKRRVALARALLRSENLLLDEPTNHLDLPTIAWLEDFLLHRAGTLVFVSHDRAFCERLATRVVEIDRGQLISYNSGFADFAAKRDERLEIEERHFAKFDRKLAQEEVWIRQGIKARRTRNMGRVRALYEMRAERAKRRTRQSNVRMLAQEAERSGKLVLEAENLAFAYPGRPPLFQGFSTVIQRGDRVGLIGANGTGKSTLLRVLLGELPPTEGSVRLGTQLHVSYFDQLRETLNPKLSVMDSVADGNDVVTINGQARHVAGYLQDFLFTPDRLRLPVEVLSGGERNRLLLARLFTQPSNLLVLDEPTNDLDMETLDLLEELLADYSGTVIMVSHDRRFLDNLVTSTLALEGDGLVHEYVGAYSDWLRQRAMPGTDAGKDGREKKAREAQRDAPGRPRKLSYNEQRELERLTADLAALPDKLAALEAEEHKLNELLADPDFFQRDPQAFAKAAERLESLELEQLEMLQSWESMELRQAELRDIGG